MALYKIDDKKIIPIERTTFAQQNLKERSDLQEMLKGKIEVIAPNTLIIAEEFGDWEDSRRRIDLLGIDKNANLIVIELKRTEDGGHMELQSIRYAAMISSLTFEKLVPIYAQYLRDNGKSEDAATNLLEFLDWEEPDEDNFAQNVKIILASAEFSKELTTSVMWLNDYGLDIKCVRMHLYKNNILDVETVIPIPEVAAYQVQIREKKMKEREARSNSRDFTKFDLSIAGAKYSDLGKRGLMFYLVSGIIKNGGHPERISEVLPPRKIQLFDGTLDADEVKMKIMEKDRGGSTPRTERFFVEEGEFFHVDGKTYVLSNQWSKSALEWVNSLIKMFPDLKIEIRPVS